MYNVYKMRFYQFKSKIIHVLSLMVSFLILQEFEYIKVTILIKSV